MEESNKDLIELSLNAYLSIRHPVAYVSMPITSGKLLYETLEKKGVRSLEELKKVDPKSIYSEIIKPNTEMGILAADNLESKLPPLAPSVFEAKKFRWTEKEYMTLWLQVIEERAREMHMTDGWEYSNGGVQEFIKAMQMQFKFIDTRMLSYRNVDDWQKVIDDMSQIKVFDLSGKEIRLEEGTKKVADAILDLHQRNFNCESLEQSMGDLSNIRDFFVADHMTSASEWHYHLAYPVNFSSMRNHIGSIEIQ